MSDLSTVRTEIKNWERNFKSKNGRDPSVQDIKNDPAVEQKYKLYKRLSKAVVTGFSKHNQAEPPSTPPRPQPRPRSSLLPSKSRVVETTAPLSTFNPFSPRKDKGKQITSTIFDLEAPANPFATPAKYKSRHPVKRNLSPDPFSPILVSQQSASTFALPPLLSPPVPASAISRARKRLRGEPVSPSPNKEKRRRVGSQLSLPFPNINGNLSSSDKDEGVEAANSSFVDDSPVKAPRGGKSFTVLFGESASSNALSSDPEKLVVRKDAKLRLFDERSEGYTSVSSTFVDAESDIGRAKASTKVSRGIGGKSRTNSIIIQSRSMPGKDSFSEDCQNTIRLTRLSKTTHPSKAGPLKPDSTIPRMSMKRTLSDTELDKEKIVNNIVTTSTSSLPLLPPSPPPADPPSHRASTKYKDKGKGSIVHRKKAKMGKEDSDADEEEDASLHFDGSQIKLIDRTRARNPTSGDGGNVNLDLDWDPIIGLGVHPIRGRHQGHVMISEQNDGTRIAGSLEVNLPEELHRVLAISPSRVQDTNEDRVVRGLLYGWREIHYDPAKGGEIWDVGEEVRESRGDGQDGFLGNTLAEYTEEEEDWEGEPVPWEVGEL